MNPPGNACLSLRPSSQENKHIFILLLCENCLHLNDVELVHSTFQVYYTFSFSVHSINFLSLILKLQLKKILICLLKKIFVLYSGTICNLALYFPSLPLNVLSYFHNLKNRKERKKKSKIEKETKYIYTA